jgi:hypothetical protein
MHYRANAAMRILHNIYYVNVSMPEYYWHSFSIIQKREENEITKQAEQPGKGRIMSG